MSGETDQKTAGEKLTGRERSLANLTARGRPKGVPNKANAKLREAARKYTGQALETLASIMLDTDETGPARVAAANSLLDRGYGKAAQPLDGDGEGGAIVHRIELIGVAP